MPGYSLNVDGIATGATLNVFTTILSLKMANTTGHRGRLRRLVVGGSGGASEDVPVDIRIRRSDNTTDGTSTAVNVNTIGSLEALQIASNLAAIGHTHAAEPTTKENGSLGGGPLNSRGTLVLEWGPGEGPLWGLNETLGIEAAPGTSTAVKLAVNVEWDE